MTQTTENWLQTIENPDIRAKALANYHSQRITDLQPEKVSLHEALTDAFVWDRTAEGVEFWNEVTFKYKQ